jgi:hypothetical protein
MADSQQDILAAVTDAETAVDASGAEITRPSTRVERPA